MIGSPSISIICPLHDKISYIRETINSVLSQTREDWELFIVENESTDGGHRENSIVSYLPAYSQFSLIKEATC